MSTLNEAEEEHRAREYVRRRELDLGQLAQRHRDISIVSEKDLAGTRSRFGEDIAQLRLESSIKEYNKHMDEWNKIMSYLRERVIEAGITTEPELIQEVDKFVEYCRQLYLDPDKQSWLKLTPEERYQRKKKDWSSHECSVHMRYGNWYAIPDKPGCEQVQLMKKATVFLSVYTIQISEG